MADTWKWDLGVSCLSEYDPDGFLGFQVDVYGEQQSGAPPFEAHYPTGIVSRHRDPDTGSDGLPTLGGNILYAWEGNTGYAFPMADPRAIGRLPRIKKGGTCVYADTGASGKPSFIAFDGDNGSQQTYVGYGSKAHSFSLLTTPGGAEAVALVHGEGMALTMAAGGKRSAILKNAAGDSYVELNDDGFTCNGNRAFFNCGRTIFYIVWPDQAHSHSLILDPTSGSELVSLIHGSGAALVMDPTGAVTIRSANGQGGVIVNPDGTVTINGNVTLNGGVVAGDPTGALPLVTAPAIMAWATQVDAALKAVIGLLSSPGAVSGSPSLAGLVTQNAITPTTKLSGA